MKFFTLTLLACILTACAGPKGDTGGLGAQGLGGSNGLDGSNGTDGSNGLDGVAGRDGVNAILEVVDPCGKQASFDEVLFRMSDGQLFAYFENGGSRYLTLIGAGSYVTTDGTACYFSVGADGSVAW